MSSTKSDNQHLHIQVINQIKQEIEVGVYKENEKLPSDFELAKKFAVSRGTIREVLQILEEENVVVHRHGVGTFVNPKPVFTSGIEQLNSVTGMIEQAGMVPGTIFLSSITQLSTAEDASHFSCSMEDEMVVIERVRTANGEPVVYCIDKVPAKIFMDNFTHEHESIYQFLENERHRKINYAIAEIEPIGYHEKVSPMLECEPETALLVLKQMHYDEMNEPILFSINYFKANKFSFHVVRRRI